MSERAEDGGAPGSGSHDAIAASRAGAEPHAPRPLAAHCAASLAVLALGGFVKARDDASDTGVAYTFSVLCGLILGYVALELLLVRRRQERWLINPAVQCGIFVHLLPTGSALLLPLLPGEVWGGSLEMYSDPWAVRYEWLNLVAAVALWTGYWSGAAAAVARALGRSALLGRCLRPGVSLRVGVALLLALVASGIRLVAIRLGLYGYAASAELRELAEAYSQYLAIAGELGKVTLVAVSLAAFAGTASRWPLLVLLVIETGFGILSGFKSAVILPALIVGMCAYTARGRIPLLIAPVLAIGLFGAYAIIQPFRAARFRELDFDGTSVRSIVETFEASRDPVYDPNDPDGPVVSTTASLFARLSDVGPAAKGIEFAERWQVLPEGSPNFLVDIFLSPLYSFVPRVLWPSKPVNDVGLWYTQVVMGEATTSSTAMYPVTYLNFAGGLTAVVLGFFVVGAIQALLFHGLVVHGGAASFVIVCLLGSIGTIDSVFYAFFISLLRNLPLLMLLQWLLFRAEVAGGAGGARPEPGSGGAAG
jgi:hypothetical protein